MNEKVVFNKELHFQTKSVNRRPLIKIIFFRSPFCAWIAFSMLRCTIFAVVVGSVAAFGPNDHPTTCSASVWGSGTTGGFSSAYWIFYASMPGGAIPHWKATFRSDDSGEKYEVGFRWVPLRCAGSGAAAAPLPCASSGWGSGQK